MSETFSAGLGMAMGLIMGHNMVKAVMPRQAVVKKFVVCQNCSVKNPVENKFCVNCGQRFYPIKIKCQKCGIKVPAMKFCGNCGSHLKRSEISD